MRADLRLSLVMLLVAGCLAGLPSPEELGGSPSGGNGNGEAGVLTAGVWDDNLNFDWYLDYLAANAQLPGALQVARTGRLVVTVTGDGGAPLPGAAVRLLENGTQRALTFTNAEGRALLHPALHGIADGTALVIEATAWERFGSADVVAGTPAEVPLALGGPAYRSSSLEVALVLDATGSMSDEITYLQAEFEALVAAVSARHPDLPTRWSVIAYRDHGDAYVVRVESFSGDPAVVKAALDKVTAGGGGDYPEAVAEALDATAKLPWSPGPVARVAFLVGDAPHHAEKVDLVAEAVRRLLGVGVTVFPIASSGVDELAEHTFRSIAQLTGGRYLFLTDDSGVGDEHKEPSLPCYFVTRLDRAILRMIDLSVTGAYAPPEPAEIIRTGGNPKDGRCTLDGGTVVQVF